MSNGLNWIVRCKSIDHQERCVSLFEAKKTPTQYVTITCASSWARVIWNLKRPQSCMIQRRAHAKGVYNTDQCWNHKDNNKSFTALVVSPNQPIIPTCDLVDLLVNECDFRSTRTMELGLALNGYRFLCMTKTVEIPPTLQDAESLILDRD